MVSLQLMGIDVWWPSKKITNKIITEVLIGNYYGIFGQQSSVFISEKKTFGYSE